MVSFAVGAWLRLHQLDAQILLDDEWHAIHRLLAADIRAIVTRLGFADYSIPLTVVDRWLYDHGMLSERWMHVPAALAGVGLLVVAPLLMRGWFGLPALATWVGLLAVSPLLVYHSMVARPYPFTALLAPVAIMAFEHWWRTRARTSVVVYVLSTLAGGLPASGRAAVRADAARVSRRAGAGVGTASLRRGPNAGWRCACRAASASPSRCCSALCLAPPVVNDWFQFSAKAGRDHLTLASTLHSAAMLAGTRHAIVAVAVFALALYGWRRLRERDAAMARYLLVVNVVAVAAVGASGIQWIFHPLVFARYLLPALVFLLLFTAEGLVGSARSGCGRPGYGRWSPPRVSRCSMPPVRCPRSTTCPTSSSGTCASSSTTTPRRTLTSRKFRASRCRRSTATSHAWPPRSVTLVELPWRLESNFNPHPWYQEVHRQNVLIGLVTPVCGERTFGEYPESATGLAMRHLIHLTAMLRGETRGADYLVVHPQPWKTPPDAEVEWPDMARCLPLIEARFGPPVDTRDGLAGVPPASLSATLGRRHRSGPRSCPAFARCFAASPSLTLLACTPLHAADYTDIWYVPTESGWGANVVQSDLFMFVTFFVYGADGKPTWYAGNLAWDGAAFSGGLYQTQGTHWALPWNGASYAANAVGTARFTPDAINAYQATLTWSVNGIGTVTKAIERQTLTGIPLGGEYIGGQTGAYSSCGSASLNGPYTDRYTLAVAQSSGVATLTFVYADSGASCTMSGTLEQHGQLYRIVNASYECSGGLVYKTSATLYELKPTSLGIEGRLAATLPSGCREDANFSAVLR